MGIIISLFQILKLAVGSFTGVLSSQKKLYLTLFSCLWLLLLVHKRGWHYYVHPSWETGSRYYYSHIVLITLVRGTKSGLEENYCANSMSSKAVQATVAANNLQNTPEWMTWTSSKPGSKSKLGLSLFISVTSIKQAQILHWVGHW